MLLSPRLCLFSLAVASLLLSTAAYAQTSDLSLAMDGSVDQTTVGQPIEYMLTVVNNGPDDTASLTLVDTLPAGQVFLKADPNANVSGNVVTFAGQTLASGSSAVYRILSQAIGGGTQTNSATVTGSSADPNTANNTAQYSLTVIGLPAVTLAATVPGVVYNSGGTGQFTLTLSAAQTSDLQVGYTVRGSATPGTDYVLLKGTAKIKAGKTTKVIKIIPEGDLGGAVKKTVVLELNDGTGYTVGTMGKVKVKILAPAE